MKIKTYVYEEEGEQYDYYRQYLYDPDDNMKVVFDVYDLTDCPEDAIIGRALFDADDYVKALNRGIELAKAGYDRVEIKE